MNSVDWAPTPNDRDAAWTLYNELRTRVTHEPLRYRDGNETVALESLHDLFQVTRAIIDKHGHQAGHFAVIARAMLNRVIRPFTSKWHRLMLSGQLEHQDHRRLFRRDLLRRQERLAYFANVLGIMAQGTAYVRDPDLIPDWDRPSSFNSNRIWPLEFLGPKETPKESVPPDDILRTELKAIVQRRNKLYGYDDEKKLGGLGMASDQAESMGLFGIAISGGGIRSATFALGALQKLAEKKILRDADYLCTVSGGGYVGSFLSSHLQTMEDVGRILVPDRGVVETSQVRWLRNRSKYLRGRGGLSSFIKWVLRLGLLVSPVVIFLAAVWIVAVFLQAPHRDWIMAGAVVLAVCHLMFSIDINRLSLGLLYRRRLAAAYIKPPDGCDSPKLSTLSKASTAPYHLICAAVNLPSSKNVELRGRRSDFFIFSQLYCGSILTGYRETPILQVCDSHLDLATAMAISGAAISTHMGTLRSWRIALPVLMFLRLSYWLPNPRFAVKARKWHRPGAFHLLRESVGRFDENHNYVNISDGGHIENLGIYELLRRRCKFILCIDGEQDPMQTCAGLVKACRFASIDMGVNIDIDLSELKPGADGFCQSHSAIGTIHYGRRDSGTEEVGYLLYLKLSMTGNEQDYIREYRMRQPSFPHQSTMNQFFDEDQFEAYRALGNHVADDLFQDELVGKLDTEKFKTGQWLESLVDALQPPGLGRE